MEIEHEHTLEVVCPNCGYEYSDSWEMQDEGDEICDECGCKFSYERDISVSYSTKIINTWTIKGF